ncbi:MAG: CpsD/CapB family tyrosine-protein kinase [Pseudomonadales bacterium]
MAIEMDPISRALERAQRDGSSVRSWVAPSPREPEPAPAAPMEARQVALDPEHLASRHILSGPDTEDPVVADKYRLLRTQLLQRMLANGWSTIGVTSPGPKAGKTLTAINLACSIARDGNQGVILIDADLRKSSMADDLGLDVSVGLIDYLTTDLALEEVAVSPEQIPNLMIIPGRRIAMHEAMPEVLRSRKMIDLIRGASSTGNHGNTVITVVDLPPVVVGDDVIAVATHLDGMLLVIEEGGTEVEELQQAAARLADFNLLGSVLNKSSEKNREVEGYYQSARKARPRLEAQ